MHQACDVSVVAAAGGIDHYPAVVDDDAVDGLLELLVEHTDGQPRLQGELEAACQAVAAAAGNDAEPRVAAFEALHHVVDGTVTTDSNHTVVPRLAASRAMSVPWCMCSV